MTNPPGAMPPLPEPVKCQPSEYCAAQHTKLYPADQLQAYAAPLIARVAELEAALQDAVTRMDRTRDILTDGKPTPQCNWGMLDTNTLRAALTPTKD